MKKTLILPALVLLLLLAACGSREAREPEPAWPDRLTGEYDDTLTFTYLDAGPAAAGVDGITGRMTALFRLDTGETLALGWRRLGSGETELLEDFLAEGGSAGIWSPDSAGPCTAESYVLLSGGWYCLSASCPELEEDALLTLLDGAVAARVREDTFRPRLPGEIWLSELPWEEPWTCLMLNDRELEPETGKEALGGLLSACPWAFAGEDCPEVPEDMLIRIWTEAGGPLEIYLDPLGNAWWKGQLRRPVYPAAGERLREACAALEETGQTSLTPPVLLCSSGGETAEAVLCDTWYWNYRSRAGELTHTEGSGELWQHRDWLSSGLTVLRADGPVRLSFSCSAPEEADLFAFTEWSIAPAALEDMTFTPYAGLNAYVLRVRWKKLTNAGYGTAEYVLLAEGAGPLDLSAGWDGSLTGEIREADAGGCVYTLTNNAEGPVTEGTKPNGLYGCGHSLFRRTEQGGWAWLPPRVGLMEKAVRFSPGNSLTWGLDWSWEQGFLEPGEYALLCLNSVTDERGQPTRWFTTPLYFTLTEDSLPAPIGPLTQAPVPEGIRVELTERSPRRWFQTVYTPEEVLYAAEQGFTLLRRLETGELEAVEAKYRLPATQIPHSQASSVMRFPVELAAVYGELEAGDYILRRRLRVYRERDFGMFADPSWRTVPEEELLYLDTPLTLTRTLTAAPMEADPLFYSPSPEGRAEPPAFLEDGAVSADSLTLRIRAPEDCGIVIAGGMSLFFLHEGEWLPVARRSAGWSNVPAKVYVRSVLMENRTIAPGETGELEFSLRVWYGPLAAGTYRLLIPAQNPIPGMDTLWLTAEFRIREDGSGTFMGYCGAGLQ